MTRPWTETGDASAMTLVFEGIDAEKREATDVEAFKSAIHTPAREKEIHGIGPSLTLGGGLSLGRKASSLDPLRMTLLAFGAFLGFGVVTLARSIAGSTNIYAQLMLFFVGLLAPVGIASVWYRSRRKSAPPVALDRFTLTMNPTGFCVAGGALKARRFDLGEIDRFEGGRRIALVRKDGTREELPCALPSPIDHSALAARLDELLVTARASAASAGGYRGSPPQGTDAQGR